MFDTCGALGREQGGPATRERTFAIRGDILSNNGYARAARAMAAILCERFRVVGVPLHVDPSDCSEPFPGDLVRDGDLGHMAQDAALAVVNHTTPDHFVPFPDCWNVGAFYWETRGIPRRFDWPERIAAMDAIWAPTGFVADFTRDCGYDGPMALVPWPQRFGLPTARRVPAAHLDQHVLLLERMPPAESETASWPTLPLSELLDSPRETFLAIQSLAPRKGLPVMVAEWCRFVAETPEDDSILLIKLAFRHAHGIGPDPRRHLLEILGRYGVAAGQRLRIGILDAHLDDAALDALVARADCLVSASFGEGFGGPIVEAIARDVPVIAPRHTGIADLIPAGYPLQVASDERCVALRDNMEIYPMSATWHLPRPGALAGRLLAFSRMSPEARRSVAAQAR
ncbi:glycosyltransferase, partial [Methylobacterium trifolii]